MNPGAGFRGAWVVVAMMTMATNSPLALAQEPKTFRCGPSDVSVFNSAIKHSPFFVLHASGNWGMSHFSFYVDRNLLQVRCDISASGKPLIVFNHICSGTGCSESNYGIIDPANGRLLLEPGDRFKGNAGSAAQVLGRQVAPFNCRGSSRNSIGDIGASGEYCFATPLELM
jgi:hypothetical protein